MATIAQTRIMAARARIFRTMQPIQSGNEPIDTTGTTAIIAIPLVRGSNRFRNYIVHGEQFRPTTRFEIPNPRIP